MNTLALAFLVLLASPPPGDPDTKGLRDAYREARETLGRDPDAHLRMALWCERHGLATERDRHLAIAVMIEPDHAAARALLGQVEYEGRWRTPDAVARLVGQDPAKRAALGDYEARRSRAKPTADDQWDLALWCEQNGLDRQAEAHLLAVVRLDPRRESAWKRLGYKKRDGLWKTDRQHAADQAEAKAQAAADRMWEARLRADREALKSRDSAGRDAAAASLAAVSDPRAVPSVLKVFARNDPARAVQLLGLIDAPASSRALASCAVYGRTESLRRAAVETLSRRDPREYADLLIGLLRDPIRYEVRPVGGPGSPGELIVAGEKFDVRRLYSPPPPPAVSLQPGDTLATDEQGLPVIFRYGGYQETWLNPYEAAFLAQSQGWNQDYSGLPDALARAGLGDAGRALGQRALANMGPNQGAIARELATLNTVPINPNGTTTLFDTAVSSTLRIPVGRMQQEAQRTAAMAQRQLETDVAALDAHNAAIQGINDRVLPALQAATGVDIGADRKAWDAWWLDALGYTTRAEGGPHYKPTLVQDVPLAYQPQPVPVDVLMAPIRFKRYSCFGAGTLVRTLTGPRPIEEIRIGDLALTQDASTGSLSFEPVVAVHHNPPSATLRVDLEGDSIVASLYHRFWKAGTGWVMARDLEPGDTVRTLDGPRKVVALAPDRVQPVFNLDVAGPRSFFAGGSGALVHDNSVPAARLAPFDAVPSLATIVP